MDPGYRSPFIDFFRRSEPPRDVRILAARGALSTSAHEQLALLLLLADDEDTEIAEAAQATIAALPEMPLRAFLARVDVPDEIRQFFAGRGIAPADVPAADASEPLLEVADPDDEDDDNDDDGDENETVDGDPDAAKKPKGDPKLLAGLPIKKKMKIAFKGTREQRAQLIRDPNKLVASAVLSSPKLTDAEVESFAKMANVSEEVLRVIGMNRTWLKNYGVVLGLVKNPKSPPAISMQLLPRINERDMKMLAVDRNVPEGLRLAARKFIVKGPK
jgi:hypothetical protein